MASDWLAQLRQRTTALQNSAGVLHNQLASPTVDIAHVLASLDTIEASTKTMRTIITAAARTAAKRGKQ